MEKESQFVLRPMSSQYPRTMLDDHGRAPNDQRAPAHQHLETGLSLYTRGRIEEALWEFFQAASDEPGNPLSHYLSGLALQALGLSDEARDEWRKVLALSDHDKPRQISDGSRRDDAWEWWPERMASRLLEPSAH